MLPSPRCTRASRSRPLARSLDARGIGRLQRSIDFDLGIRRGGGQGDTYSIVSDACSCDGDRIRQRLAHPEDPSQKYGGRKHQENQPNALSAVGVPLRVGLRNSSTAARPCAELKGLEALVIVVREGLDLLECLLNLGRLGHSLIVKMAVDERANISRSNFDAQGKEIRLDLAGELERC